MKLSNYRLTLLWITGAAILLLPIIIIFLRGLKVIRTGSVAVVEVVGNISEVPLKPGVHWVNPWGNVAVYSSQMKDVKQTIEATSQEGLEFNVDVSLQYRIDPNNVIGLYEIVGRNEEEIVISRFRSVVRMITALYPVESIYSVKRQELSEKLEANLRRELEPLGLIVDGVYIREVMLPESFQSAIQNKLNVDQQARESTFKIEQSRKEVDFKIELARKEAERKRIEARGTADAQAILATQKIPELLSVRSLEVIEKLADSTNTKIVILENTRGNNVPLTLEALMVQGGGSPQSQPQQ